MPESKIELSIIIISYNTKKITQDCLESIETSLKHSEISYETIVVDNASTDGSDKLSGNFRLIKNDKNLGFAKANNQGVREAK